MRLWVDIETTGLDPHHDVILEIAAILTDDAYDNEIVGPSLVVEPVGMTLDEAIGRMDPYVLDMHTKNGLIAELRAGRGVRRYEAEAEILDWARSHSPKLKGLGEVRLAGSSVHFDRSFLAVHMPALVRAVHYRNHDVSTLKEACQTFAPEVAALRPRGEPAHRALADIRESIAEARFYRDNFLRRRALAA